MPKSSRQNIKQNIDTALRNMEKAELQIVIVAQPYKEVHPEYYEAFSGVVAGLHQMAEMLKAIRDNI